MSDTERNSILANNFRYNMGFLTKSALACYNIVPSDQVRPCARQGVVCIVRVF